MKDIKKEVKQSSLINEKIRASGFVPYKSNIVESFKNNRIHNTIRKISPKLQNLKRSFKSIIEKPRLWAAHFDWKTIRNDSTLWFSEALIEGAIANWWTHKIFGLEFGMGMIIAHGFLIKQGLDLYRRIIKDGSNTKILTKNKQS